MATGLTLDTGALIAAEKNSREFWLLWREAVDNERDITVPSVALAQAWRGTNALMARAIALCDIERFAEAEARPTGLLLARSKTTDVVDAAVVLSAASRGDVIVTSDPRDIRHLMGKAGKHLQVVVL
jgi:hypothetical protein